ncbi:STT3 domain-containing protein [Nitrosopumilus adriaticus]|uniref:dolichyl-phosphooligosaccharide-protein glycotransferase n=1 Tax=Nitrosopumilus adriaticus TaxID=1580092 RepID=A0A0D5C689_9ARCH|nr:STT3 domain-containing protein [Nitrosopumilus adriaticus]AJW71870.1 Oligosaccharyl transferase STT3 subunit [Nitrosopumilus adriaticus]
MNSHANIFSIGKFDFKLQHLLIIGILAISFSMSFMIRSEPANYGWELNEFDPYFNYRATQYIVENGFDSYFQWNDDLSWYPHGRDVSHTSQVMLHITAATTYWIFGSSVNLYDFTILFPVIIGSLTTVVVFALVRTIGGTTSGLFSALLFSISLPIIIRGQVGWFKSEPLGLFFSILAVYLFLSALKSKNYKITIPKMVAAGIFIVFGLSAWGGDQFFIIPLGLFIMTLPFLRKDHKFLIWIIPIFTISSLIASLGFERLGIQFVVGLGGLSLIIPTIFLVTCIFIQNKSNEYTKNRNGLFFLAAILIISSGILILNHDSQFIPLPTHRYLNAINPLLTTTDPLVDSVSEHATTTISQSFLFHSVLMIFAGIGIWLILKNHNKSNFIKNDMISFALIFGLIGVYVSSAFVRLEVFASLSIIILSSLGLSALFKEFFSNKIEIKKFKIIVIKSSFAIGIMLLLIVPLLFPVNGNIFSTVNNPPTILNGGSSYRVSTTDWVDTLDWIKNNTEKDAVIATWWDYGYWIQTKAERATLADNSTLITSIIEKIATAFLSPPDEGKNMLLQMESDYIVIFIVGQRLGIDNGDQPLYTLGGGGDESKKQWFMKIANEPVSKYLQSDGISGTDYFWNETLLGKMIPFTPLGYVNLATNQQSQNYQPGFTGIYTKDIKFPEDGDGPLRLVYSSPSFDIEKGGQVIGVFVYEINKENSIN